MSRTDIRLNLLLGKLDDELDLMVCLQSTAETLGEALIQAEDEFDRSFNALQPEARKHWSALQDHLHERRGHLLGLLFVLAQAALTQTVSLLKAVRAESHAPISLPTEREAILKTYAPVDPHTNLSIFVILDTAANYFKHHLEWSDDWIPKSAQQARTIARAQECGMQPGWFTDNLEHTFNLLNRDPAEITAKISEWRHRLARDLYKELKLADPAWPIE